MSMDFDSIAGALVLASIIMTLGYCSKDCEAHEVCCQMPDTREVVAFTKEDLNSCVEQPGRWELPFCKREGNGTAATIDIDTNYWLEDNTESGILK